MGKLKSFDQFLTEAVQSSETTKFIADEIQAAVGGLGTNEERFMNAVSAIPNLATLVKVNEIFSSDSKYSYKTVGDAINGELGFLDGYYKGVILAAVEKIGGKNYLTAIKLPVQPTGDIVKSIIPRVKQHEGVKPKKYIDSRGIPTVGVGFNLRRGDADQKLKSVGANPIKVKQGKQDLTIKQIDSLLISDLMAAKKAAEDLVPGLISQPGPVQGVMTEMAFNLGKAGLAEFKNFLTSIKNKKYTEASKEMLNSNWSKQVGLRAKTLADIVSAQSTSS
jgi:lysozyme